MDTSKGTERKTRGVLKFKGARTTASSKKKRERPAPSTRPNDSEAEIPESDTTLDKIDATPVLIATVEAGSGRIVASGVTVNGFETKFKEEAAIGDVLIIFHPKQLLDEERIIVGILSQRCLSLNESFSADVPSTIAYRIRKDSKLILKAAEKALKTESLATKHDSSFVNAEEDVDETGPEKTKRAKLLQDEISRQLQKKLSKSKPLLTYREKTGMWGYKVVTEKVGKNVTAEELLDLRSKKQGRDKFCW